MALLLRREVWRHKIQIREIKGLHGICRKFKIKSRRAENYILYEKERSPRSLEAHPRIPRGSKSARQNVPGESLLDVRSRWHLSGQTFGLRVDSKANRPFLWCRKYKMHSSVVTVKLACSRLRGSQVRKIWIQKIHKGVNGMFGSLRPHPKPPPPPHLGCFLVISSFNAKFGHQ